MTEIKKDRLLLIATWVKGVTGAVGMSALITDHKWVGIGILVVGAMANEYVNMVTKSKA
jgi:hypothetical protein